MFEMHEFPEYLQAQGWEVFFLHFPEGESQRSSGQGSKELVYERYQRLRDSAPITLVTPEILGKGRVLSRLVSALGGFRLVNRVLNEIQPDLIFLYAVPTWGWQTVFLANRKDIPLVFRAIDLSHSIRRTVFGGLIRIASRYVFSNASRVLANSPAMLSHAHSLGAKSGTVLYPLIKTETWSTSSKSNTVAGNPKSLIFLGTFFRFAGLIELVREFAKQSRSDEHLILIGSGPDYQRVQNVVSDLGVSSRVRMPGWVDFEALGDYLNEAAVAVNPMEDVPVANLALPNKVLQYLSFGLPVISTRLDGLETIFGAQPSCDLKLVDSIDELVSAALDRARRPKNFRPCVQLESMAMEPVLQSLNRQLGEVLKS